MLEGNVLKWQLCDIVYIDVQVYYCISEMRSYWSVLAKGLIKSWGV